jgi:hypothetical protein
LSIKRLDKPDFTDRIASNNQINMKNCMLGKGILVGIATLALGGVTFADTQVFTAINDYTDGGANLGPHLSATGHTQSLTDTFDLTADGFVPGVDTAVAGLAFFDLTDFVDPLNRDRVSIDLGSIDPTGGGAVGDYLFTFSALGGADALSILADINADGTLDYEITATRGDFYVDGAELDVRATVPGPASVPDGGATMTLLGMGLFGVSVAGRKIR